MRLELFEEVCLLYESEEKKIFLVRHKISHMFYVKKYIYNVGHRMIYEMIKENTHSHLVQVIDVMQKQDILIVIEEFINGVSLEYRLSQGPCTQQECVKILNELFSVISHLHHLQPCIVHRDIKPANIFSDSQGHIKLMDMEIARHVQEHKKRDTTIMGSVGYAAPEQYGFTQTDARSDIYAIGVLIKELYFGQDTMNLPRTALTALIQRCMMMEPNDRYQSIEELQQAYHNAIGIADVPTPTMLKAKKYVSRKHILRYALYLIFLLISINLTFNEQDAISAPTLWLMRITFFLWLISGIWITQNVCNIRKFSPLQKSQSKAIRILGAVLLWYMLAFIIIAIGVIVSMVIESML